MRPRRYKLLIARRFQKDLHRLQPQTRPRILEALERLAENPYMGEKVVAAATGQYRYRVGDYRIRYDIAGDEAHILRVRHRREVYREE
ncbi:MAG TPA: type II toxin-antitoxin system RelE/ParE family toxin [Dehalococcoidia bacterium]|nr:type II toxin-antitoxin system RelE/ParE family toxin [Dehalococcoidia bacterium]HLB28865.1 type II toxin-antitoxin system RelE/ParE family toxin [Dehalococcoidia bacterium]